MAADGTVLGTSYTDFNNHHHVSCEEKESAVDVGYLDGNNHVNKKMVSRNGSAVTAGRNLPKPIDSSKGKSRLTRPRQLDSGDDLNTVDDDDESADQNEERQPLLEGDSKNRKEHKFCSRTNNYIYVSHFLSAWGDNMWTFAVGVFLVEINEDSLLLTAIFGLTMGTCTLLLGPIIGDWVDNMPRLRAAQEALVLQNVMIALCAGFIFNLLQFKNDIDTWGQWAPIAHYVIIIVLGTGAFLAHIANVIAVEKDWVVEICQQDDDKLAAMTSTMRAIDLTAMIAAPIATGQVMTIFSGKIGALTIAVWNVASFFVEYLLLWLVYKSVPALQKEKNIITDSQKEDSQSGLQRLLSGVTIIISGWRTYIRYEVALSGISLALLYMTVLGFDNVTIGYAKMQCLTEFEVGLTMGAAGLVGALGTVMYPAWRRCIGLPWTGIWALTLQIASLSMCVVSIWLPGSTFDMDSEDSEGVVCEVFTNKTNVNLTVTSSMGVQTVTSEPDITSVLVLMAGIVAARFGLWIADLAITQMFLETVVENERGIVNGVQQSLNQVMDLIKCVLVIIFPKTNQFGLLVIASYTFVFSGWLLYVVFLIKIPRQIFQKKTSVDV